MADCISLKSVALRLTAVLCCLLVLLGAVTSLTAFTGQSSVWGRWSISRKSAAANDHLQVFEEDRDERYALACDEYKGMVFDHQTADTTTVAPITENTQSAAYGVASRYLIDQTITLYLDKNIIGSSE